jgi:hypothetical protein
MTLAKNANNFIQARRVDIFPDRQGGLHHITAAAFTDFPIEPKLTFRRRGDSIVRRDTFFSLLDRG